MKIVKIAGAIINGIVYVNESRLGLNLEAAASPEAGFTEFGWWFPSDNNYLINKVLSTGKDDLRHEDVVYQGTCLRPDRTLVDVKLAGHNYRLMSVHNTTPVVVIPTDEDSSFVSTFVERLSCHPELDDVGHGEWSAERLMEVLSAFPGNNRLVEYMPLSDLLSELANRTIRDFPTFPRTGKD